MFLPINERKEVGNFTVTCLLSSWIKRKSYLEILKSYSLKSVVKNIKKKVFCFKSWDSAVARVTGLGGEYLRYLSSIPGRYKNSYILPAFQICLGPI